MHELQIDLFDNLQPSGLPFFPELFEHRAESSILVIDPVAQEMNIMVVAIFYRELYRGYYAKAGVARSIDSLVDTIHRVMVGQGHCIKPGVLGHDNKFGRGEYAVRCFG